MNTISKAVFTTMLAAGIAAGAPQVLAQNAPTRTAHTWKRHHGPSQRLAHLKAQLKITSEQEGAWNAFVQAMANTRPQHAHHAMHHQPGALTPAPEVLEARAQRMQEWAQRAAARAQAMKALYSALTPTQRAIIDTHLADMQHRFRARFHRG
ncbi:MAG TPA: Spy/CpxP family protein refolding chaperone [Gammaproteobacteria bacterium]|nr:Spy/CpxP family protein refolding chaperone [Gammaproteobacteria bacterium]